MVTERRQGDAIDREHSALASTFRRALTIALAAHLACSTKSAIEPGPDAGGPDVGTSPPPTVDAGDAGDAADASVDARCDETRFVPTPPDTCGDYVRLPCGLPQGVVAQQCYLGASDCAGICPDIHFDCHVTEAYCPDGGTVMPDDAGAIVIDCSTCPTGAGRMPPGLEATTTTARSAVGSYLARAAHFEAASAYAFRRLGDELAEHGAPDDLVQASSDAQRDEVRHARAVARLARRFGGRYVRPRVRRTPPRSLEAIATDNAVEGCVRETFGALVVSWQSRHARDPEVARTLAQIAADELRHAALSWAVARWTHERLDDAARSRVEATCRDAIRELGAAYAPVTGLEALGLPAPSERRVLIEELTRTLWSESARWPFRGAFVPGLIERHDRYRDELVSDAS